MSRIQARELAFKIIFAYQFEEMNEDKSLHNDFIYNNGNVALNEENISKFFEENNLVETEYKDFCLSIVNSFFKNKQKIEEIIEKNIEGYKISRVYKCDLAIIKLAVAEMLAYEYDFKIVINAAVELAKKYSEDKSYKFVNSVLSKIVKEIYNE